MPSYLRQSIVDFLIPLDHPLSQCWTGWRQDVASRFSQGRQAFRVFCPFDREVCDQYRSASLCCEQHFAKPQVRGFPHESPLFRLKQRRQQGAQFSQNGGFWTNEPTHFDRKRSIKAKSLREAARKPSAKACAKLRAQALGLIRRTPPLHARAFGLGLRMPWLCQVRILSTTAIAREGSP